MTQAERELAAWLLEHGTSEAAEYMSQLDLAEVTPERCACGCASINFRVQGRPEAPPGVNILADYQFRHEGQLCGVFIFSSGGTLSGLEVFGYEGEAPRILPTPPDLLPCDLAPNGHGTDV